MLAGGAVAVVGAAGAYIGMRRATADPPELVEGHDGHDDEPELVEAPCKTWKEASGRAGGRDGYVFGDLSRGVIVRVFGKGEGAADEAERLQAEGDARQTQVQRLVREAVRLYRARGYSGSINMSHQVAYFNESVSVRVDGPGKGEEVPWEKAVDATDNEAAVDETVEELARAVTKGAVGAALDDGTGSLNTSEAAVAQLNKEGQAGLVFATLLARLERRAKSWQALCGEESLDPSLTQAAQIGFALPVIKIGWGVSISLTVNSSSLLRWSEHAASATKAATQ